MQHISRIKASQHASEALNEFGRRPLDRHEVAENAEALMPGSPYKHQVEGYFAQEEHARVTEDGYIEVLCYPCTHPIIVTMVNHDGVMVPEPLEEGVRVELHDHLECPGCAVLDDDTIDSMAFGLAA